MPDEKKSDPPTIGWFSPSMVGKYGSHIYLTTLGEEVEVTQVSREDKNPYAEALTDVVRVGPVVRYVRKGRERTMPRIDKDKIR